MPTLHTCARCSRTMWSKGTPRADRPAGSVLHTGRGLCTTCYARAQLAGTLPPRAASASRSAHPCARCGISTTERDLCTDCRYVGAVI